MPIAHIYNGELGFDVRTKLNALIDQVAAIPVGPGGSGDVTGPAGAIADNIAVYNGISGKLIKDGGQTIAAVIAAAIAGSGGSTILHGSGPPADALGSAGDYYIDIDSGIMYGPKAVASVGVTENILDGSIPGSSASGVELHGGDFNILLSGTAVGARFWRHAGSGLTSRNLVLYNAATGVTLATATTTAETGSG